MSTDVWILVVVAALLAAVTAAVAVTLLVRLVRMWGLLRRSGVTPRGRAVFWAAVVYLVCPVDLLPDPVLLDDIGALALALRSLNATVEGRKDRPPAG